MNALFLFLSIIYSLIYSFDIEKLIYSFRLKAKYYAISEANSVQGFTLMNICIKNIKNASGYWFKKWLLNIVLAFKNVKNMHKKAYEEVT